VPPGPVRGRAAVPRRRTPSAERQHDPPIDVLALGLVHEAERRAPERGEPIGVGRVDGDEIERCASRPTPLSRGVREVEHHLQQHVGAGLQIAGAR
jgi:hypothetical protein